ncbi:MAG: hypothetical protein HZB39_13185 [Planctomycetes bacterium]|nr:hypothetical protein [Planctomycetota bacterium]
MKPLPLALDDLPPFRVPLRFFLTAPLFGVLAGIVVIVEGETVFASRWSPALIGATHLLTLGWLAMVMIGALFQVVPVLSGRGIPAAARVAAPVHLALTLGTLGLAYGLVASSPNLVALGLGGLLAAFLLFGGLLAWRVLRPSRGGGALVTIRFAVLALFATVALGAWMAAGIAWPSLGIPYRASTDSHARFGLFGWVLLLVMGVSQQVVPMFHVTPPFPAAIARGCGVTVFGGLILLATSDARLAVVIGASATASASLAWAIALLAVLAKRKRRRTDATVRAWQLACWVLIGTAPIAWQIAVVPDLPISFVARHQQALLLGVLVVLGFCVTVVLGMLQKIVPFLAFTHLQRRALKNPAAIPLLPAMEDFVSTRTATIQIAIHATAIALTIAAAFEPAVARAAGAALCVDFAFCAVNLTRAALRYRRVVASVAERE